MTNKLFVTSLPYTVTDPELLAHFESVGDVLSARVVFDKDTGRSKGFGFVEMATPELARRAIDTLNEAPLAGRNLIVKVSEPPASRAPRPASRRF